ncbi:Crp/Fnr family transcriptional regulator [Erythrobacter sp. THAF29]|uniref:Crp/Fnr family transcriptional regulator n=1 Tax=Erythrobacter sp. THAF29 TaxID=2587851 RepID=UPI001561BF7B|nr:helix-turn-helix domain-containing protein [Erythrobacter sp. THAF29]
MRDIEPFACCSPEVIARLETIAQRFALPSSEALPETGHGERIVFITGGAAKLIAPGTPKGHILAFQFPGDIVSISHRPEGSATLVALSELELVMFLAHEFLDAAEIDPALLRAVLVRSLDTIQRNRIRMMRLGHRTARQRVAGFLVNMGERLCGCTSGPCELDLPMGRGDIGNSLGLTIETVSRQFTELRGEGFVTTSGRSAVHIADIDALRREAGP